MLETPSGKNASTENFPVASWILPKNLRPHIISFYNFARAIDDIADNPKLETNEKITRLDAFGKAVKAGSDDKALITAHNLYQSLNLTETSPQHCLDLITAFKQDAVQSRYQDWASLMQYCRYSAAPVGRYLLDLHGEDKSLYPASDALCSALQVINHLQDVAEDYFDMNRVYVPEIWLEAENIDVDSIGQSSASPELRRVFNQMLDNTQILLKHSKKLAPAMQNKRLAAETRIIQKIAETLTDSLYHQDPIAQRVRLSKPQSAIIALRAILKF